jgi:hypothetical protein
MANQFKKYFFILALLQIFTAYLPAYAQTTSYDYSQGGKNPISSQIREYLCAPSEVNSSSRDNAALGVDQNSAAFKNNNSGDLYKCINQLYKFAIILAGVVGVFFVVIAGYVYMSAEGNQESVDKAKSILTSTIASLVILMSGFLLLKAINPDLIQFKSIQPPSVKISELGNSNDVQVSVDPSGNPTKVVGGVGGSAAAELEANGCTFQTAKQKTEAQYMTQGLFDKIKSLCYNVSKRDGKGSPAISSVIGQGQHSANSYHYKGCGIDFADGSQSGFIILDKTTGQLKGGSKIGQAIYFEALQQGFTVDRINPGSDRDQTFHIHLDLGSSCTSK